VAERLDIEVRVHGAAELSHLWKNFKDGTATLNELKDARKAFANAMGQKIPGSEQFEAYRVKHQELDTAVKQVTASMRGQAATAGTLHQTYFELGTVLRQAATIAVQVAAAFASAKFVRDAIESEARVKLLREELERLGRTKGFDATLLLKEMEKATAGTVRQVDLLQIAFRAVGLRVFDLNKLPELMRMLEFRSKLTGISTRELFDEFTRLAVIGKERMQVLFGITFDAKRAIDDYARSVGTTAAALSDTEQNAVTMKLAFDALKRSQSEVSSQAAETIESLERFNVVLDDLKRTLGSITIPLLVKPLQFISAMIEIETHRLKEYIASVKEFWLTVTFQSAAAAEASRQRQEERKEIEELIRKYRELSEEKKESAKPITAHTPFGVARPHEEPQHVKTAKEVIAEAEATKELAEAQGKSLAPAIALYKQALLMNPTLEEQAKITKALAQIEKDAAEKRKKAREDLQKARELLLETELKLAKDGIEKEIATEQLGHEKMLNQLREAMEKNASLRKEFQAKIEELEKRHQERMALLAGRKEALEAAEARKPTVEEINRQWEAQVLQPVSAFRESRLARLHREAGHKSLKEIEMTLEKWQPITDVIASGFSRIGTTIQTQVIEKLFHAKSVFQSFVQDILIGLSNIAARLAASALAAGILSLITGGPFGAFLSSLTGGLIGGGGGGGGGHRALQHGGIISEPVVGFGMRTAKVYTLAERGPEFVSPLTSPRMQPVMIQLGGTVNMVQRGRDLIGAVKINQVIDLRRGI
jgi:tetratricopeptide (TPR) repeat protein